MSSATDPKTKSEGKYMHGHHSTVLRSHEWRTARNSCAYLLPHLKPNMRILDVGCGPGTITCDLASYIPQGHITGMDAGSSVISKAQAHAADLQISNVAFAVGDIYELPYPEGTFDVVHAHQVMQHMSNPVRAMKEMRRVTKKDGLVACREMVIDGCMWYPPSQTMADWIDLFLQVCKGLGGHPEAARQLHVYAKEAGFARSAVTTSAGVWKFCEREEREFWGGMWADRTVTEDYRKNTVGAGHCKDEDLERIARVWREWVEDEDGWFVAAHGEVVCRKE